MTYSPTKIQCFPKTETTSRYGDAALTCVEEAIASLRYKDVRSTTIERMHLTREADARVQGLSQPQQLGEGLDYLLSTISVPVHPHDLILGRISEKVPDADEEAFFQATIEEWHGRGIPLWMRDGGHECFAWDDLLRLGLCGLQGVAQQELERRSAAGESKATLDFLRGAMRVYGAFRHYARRYAAAAREAGLEEAGTRCAAVAERRPGTFAEALQLMWLVGHVYCTMTANNSTLTFGRLDELLLPFYRQGLAEGSLTRQDAGDLIEDFYCKNNLILGRGEHQMGGGSDKDTGWARNLTYDSPQYIVLGGRRVDGSAAANELTALFLERIVPRFENPVVVLRYTPDLPDPVWRLACEKMRANASMMVYNDQNIIPAMVHCGIEPDEALTYTMHGCNWPDIPAVQRALRYHFIRLPDLLLDALLSGQTYTAIDQVYARFTALFRAEIDAYCQEYRDMCRAWAQEGPGPLQVDDCFLRGPIARARSHVAGGVKYSNIIFSIVGIASAADSLAALDKLVFQSGQLPLETLKQALREDFEGQEGLRLRCLRAPKFGQDDDRADRHAVRLLELVTEEIDQAVHLGSEDQIAAFRCLETDMRHIWFGSELEATPDGRHAGQPINENTSPAPGSCTEGLTAMFRSLAKLPFHRINSGALNVRLQPRLFAGEEGLTRLAKLLRTYLDIGGLQVQLSFADVQELRDAQAHPECHRDLMVRITGYSAAFVDMTPHAQEEIIRREEMGP